MTRQIIIDISVYGMGRGAGNLNSELFLAHLNDITESRYSIKPIVNLMDEVIGKFYDENPWGYSLPNYLSAFYMIHPNYATYLEHKKTLTLKAMGEIFDMMDPQKSLEYDEQYIEQLYITYLSRNDSKDKPLEDLARKICGRKVLLIAPGKNSFFQKEQIQNFIKTENPVVFSINHDYPHAESDYIFISNLRRFGQLHMRKYYKTIITSNIDSEEVYARIDYRRLLNEVDHVKDNAGLMAIAFLSDYSASEFILAGFDGYSHDVYENYGTDDVAFLNNILDFDKINQGMIQVLKNYRGKLKINFLTDSILIPKILTI